MNVMFMPTVRIIGPYRFYFYSHEPNEPPHIHVDRGDFSAKFWLNEISLAKNFGFRQKEIKVMEELVTNNQKLFLDKWHEYFRT